MFVMVAKIERGCESWPGSTRDEACQPTTPALETEALSLRHTHSSHRHCCAAAGMQWPHAPLRSMHPCICGQPMHAVPEVACRRAPLGGKHLEVREMMVCMLGPGGKGSAPCMMYTQLLHCGPKPTAPLCHPDPQGVAMQGPTQAHRPYARADSGMQSGGQRGHRSGKKLTKQSSVHRCNTLFTSCTKDHPPLALTELSLRRSAITHPAGGSQT
jgi:hypothetical protein